MKKAVLFFLSIVITVSIYAQNPKNIKIIESKPIIEKGSGYQEKDEFEKSVQQFKKIPLGDSLYGLAQYKMALSYYYQELYDKSALTLEYLIENPSSKVPVSSIYNLLGYVYMGKKDHLKAANILEYALYLTPYNYKLLAAQGRAYIELNELEKAEIAIKKAIFCAPTYQYAHYLLGNLYLKQGKIIPAILAYNYVAFLDPKTDQSIDALKALNELFVGFTEIVDNETNQTFITDKMREEDERFQILEQLVGNNIAMTKKFKLKSKIDHIIVRQSQLVLENLPNSNGSKDILDYVYIPFFKAIIEKEYFNLYSYHILSGTNVNNNEVMEKAKKMEKKLKVITDLGFQMLKDQVLYGIGIDNNETPKREFEYNKDEDRIESIGGYSVTNEKGKHIYNGKWTIIDENGAISALVNVTDGIKNGTCFFYSDGFEIQKIDFLNDSINGTAYVYYPTEKGEDKLINIEIPFTNNKLNGVRKEYSRSGILLEETNYNDDGFDGPFKTYDFHGHLESKGTYKVQKHSGLFEEYYPNGAISSQVEYDENESGPIKRFYPDGKIKLESTAMNGHYFGASKTYFPNGKIETIGSYDENGNEDGFWTFYYKNGSIAEEVSFKNGKIHGENKVYSLSGFLYATYMYENGILKSITTYLPNNEVRKTTTINEGVFEVDLYNDFGIKFANKIYDEEKGLIGIETKYYPSGKIYQTIAYKDNKKDGVETTYFENGKIKKIVTYKQNIENGLYISYYENDTISVEGLYSDGKQIGAWYSYYINGAIESVDLFDDGFIVKSTKYYPDGNQKNESLYKNKLLTTLKTYDHQNKLLKEDHFKNGNGILSNYYFNGNLRTKGNIIANEYCDSLIEYDFNGNILTKDYFVSGLYNGKYEEKDPVLEKTIRSGNTVLNHFHGNIKSLSYLGIYEIEENYEFGSLEGEKKFIFNNKLNSTHFYINNNRNGISHFYSPDGKTLMYSFKYVDGDVVAISYMDKNQKMTQWVPITADPLNIIAYYPDQKKSTEFSFKNGVRDGKEVIYYPNEKIFYETLMENNYEQGKLTINYPNGNPRLITNNYYDLLDGSYIKYYENGKIEMEGSYKFNYPHGIFKYYNPNGELVKEVAFYYGNIVNQK
ncbi:MAG TPA: hypothetical protein PLM70_04825 [Bacteroidales bacterium]|nr:hypothetical protein [Bacteroidales bacterium]